jgi:hypothetical protein
MSHPVWTHGGRTGPIRRHKQLVFFACEGLVALYDERKTDEDYMVLTPAEFKERATALNEFGTKIGKTDPTRWQRQESHEMVRAAADMTECVKEAKSMGDPSDPAVQAFWARHRRSSVVSMSQRKNDFEHGMPKKTLDQIKKDSKGTQQGGQPTGDDEVRRVVAQAEAGRVRRLPRKKPRKGRLILDL